MTTPGPARLHPGRNATLVKIKLLHTAVWLLFAGCIVAIPVAGAGGHYLWAAALTGLVLVECGVLAANRGVCPLTTVAARYTEQRTPNFDIYLPVWLARYNKTIFGVLFVIGGLFVLGRWWTA
jgi:hypothetical protein